MRRLALACALAAGCATGATTTPPDLGGASPDLAPAIDPLAEAASRYPDLRTLWSRSISRTCGPNNGVCHNSRQFPDLQTASGLLSAVGARCNQIRDELQTIDNLCEPTGDTLQLDGSFGARIGTVTPMPADAPTQLVIKLAQAAPQGTTASAPQVVRTRSGQQKVTLPVAKAAVVSVTGDTVTLSLQVLSDPKQSPGPAAGTTMADFFLPAQFMPGDDTQVELGDPNGDGVFGADLGGALIKPGAPEKSYLFLRVLQPLAGGQQITNMTTPGDATDAQPQMPIANQQYWDIDHDLTALWCWISGLAPDGSNADGPIDYAKCDVSKMPAIAHQGNEASTFTTIYEQVLVPSCAQACHAGQNPATKFVLPATEQAAYDVLLGVHGERPTENPDMPYVTPSDPAHSFLFLKLTGASGTTMPLGGMLSPQQIEGIQTWIQQRATFD